MSKAKEHLQTLSRLCKPDYSPLVKHEIESIEWALGRMKLVDQARTEIRYLQNAVACVDLTLDKKDAGTLEALRIGLGQLVEASQARWPPQKGADAANFRDPDADGLDD